MNRKQLEELWSDTLRSPTSGVEQFAQLARAVVEIHLSGDPSFRQHIQNRLKQIAERTGEIYDTKSFDLVTAHTLIADEIGFANWDELINAVTHPSADSRPILFRYAIAAMIRGDFSALESMVGGPDRFDDQIIAWHEKGYFADEPETLAEVFSAACMLGYDDAAAYLLDKGVDPYAGMKTGLSGFHYAASSGRLNVIKLLIARKIPMEVRNMYGGTVLDQAIWSAVNEYTPDHAAIVEALAEAGAVIEPDFLKWWKEQNVPDAETKRRVSDVLQQYAEFHARVRSAEAQVNDAESGGSKKVLADSLKALGNILRRPPFLREAANEAYARAAELYRELGMPLEESWVKRHIGLNHEYAERLDKAERYYDGALELYRTHATENTLDYANTVRYPAVIKNRVGKRDESRILWEEAAQRYDDVDAPVGVAEAAAHLTLFALDKGDTTLAREWFARADAAAAACSDPDTDKFIAEVKARLIGENTDEL